MIRVHRLRNGSVSTETGLAAVRPPVADERTWYVVVEPTPEEAAAVVAALPFHELAMEDALKEGHPPKLEEFDDHLFVIVHTPSAGAECCTRKLAVFLGSSWLASVQRVPLPYVDDVEARILKEPKTYLASPDRAAHALVDHMLDSFEQLTDEFVDRADELEDRLLTAADPKVIEELLDQRRHVGALLRLMRAQRDVTQALSRCTHRVLPARIRPYLRDLYDHTLRIHDLLDGVRETLAVAREGYLSAQNQRLSETMRVLTVIATIMMPLSLIAGVFGMNFTRMPLLDSPTGFWISVGLMGGIAAGMLLWFRRRGWI